tara:strand:- start:7086 stop:7325 length:240 start_codon:yes stop_codon:yes gene_type:complete
MPSEVSDIKQFIEICRRKDAKCTFPLISRGRLWRMSKRGKCDDAAPGQQEQLRIGMQMDERKGGDRDLRVALTMLQPPA